MEKGGTLTHKTFPNGGQGEFHCSTICDKEIKICLGWDEVHQQAMLSRAE